MPVDLSMTELSAAIGQGKSPAGSNGPSPSHILKFIEEQKQKGGGGIELWKYNMWLNNKRKYNKYTIKYF